MENEECKFKLKEIYKNTYEDNGEETCNKCKHYLNCKDKQLKEEMEQIYREIMNQ